jgi:uncharacterized membrane protein HdeD (DUF308 family)
MIFENTTLDLDAVASRWWALVVRGIAGILFGALTLVWPGISLFVLVLMWGAYALADGVFSIALSAAAGTEGRPWGWLLFEGLVGLAAGFVTFFWPGITAVVLLAIIAAWALFTGFAEIVAAFELRRVIENEWMLALSGVLSIGFGVLMAVYPRVGALAVVTVIGFYAIAFGSLLVALGMRLHRLAPSSHHPSSGTPSHA